MAHFAKCKLQDDGTYKVLRVNAGRDEDNETDLTNRETEEGVIWKKTSYGTRAGAHYSKNELGEWEVDRNEDGSYDRSKAYRKNYAAMDYIYDPTLDGFISPQPYPSWTLKEEAGIWESPLGPKPQVTAEMMAENQHYDWNEENQSWDIVTIPTP
tara:strand:+ start:514 stop:978 length:465 start_codon:yes stop_codon:yes gene_type:complete